MNKTNFIEYIKKTTDNTKDREYNKGRQDIINGNFITREATYFFMCEPYLSLIEKGVN